MVKGDVEEVVTLTEGVRAEGMIEQWLCVLEREMVNSMREVCRNGSNDCMRLELEPFVEGTISQVALLGVQMLWTSKVQEALEKNQKERLSEMDKKKRDINNIMEVLSRMCLKDYGKIERTKVETLVTVHVHQRDLFLQVQEDAKAHKLKDANDFDWCKNTRIFWKPDIEQVAIHITDVEFIYSYEFLGAKERLCITPLTDRCYITLSQALNMVYGGAPAGPAGTGKTETVKDMGCCLGIFVVVTNCSGEHKFRDMASIFKGISQSGLWGCFDEFNRISLPTLSVVAAQVQSINNAKKLKLKMFMFPDEKDPILLVLHCGYFITMNPGYAGRQELPENLKVLFRGVCMMTPDRRIIMMTKLASVGYRTFEVLAKKFNILYKLCEEQLSKQRHYDFGLRNILSVLRTAGNTLRVELKSEEEMLLCRTLRDMNKSKMVAEDLPLFAALLGDIFPKQTYIPGKVYKEVSEQVTRLVKENDLVHVDDWVLKCIQLYETAAVRHGFMVCGMAGCGKTTISKTLTDAMTANDDLHRIVKLNPKSITGQQMYGVMNNTTGEWTQGVFSSIWAKYNDRKSKYSTWITCDGPVDAIWIENLNTVLDDNKILTLANNDRIPMTDNVKMAFEVEDLNNASPATVSRCGIVFVSETDLGWMPLITTWIADRIGMKCTTNPEEPDWIREFAQKYFWYGDDKIGIFDILTKQYVYVMFTPAVIRVTQFINLMEAIMQQIFKQQKKIVKNEFEKLFVFCFGWAIGGLFENEEREKFHKLIETIGGPMPAISAAKMGMEKETLYDYFFNIETMDWKIWEGENWQPPKRMAFSQLLIPTMDSTRTEYLIEMIDSLPSMRSEKREENGLRSCLLVGGPGTAKTSVILMYTSKFKQEEMLLKMINFSSATSPEMFQDSIEGDLDRKQGKTFTPPGGKKMTVFIDDMSMPKVNDWGDQETLEIARQLIELKGLYFLNKDQRGDFRKIELLQFLGCMNIPGGGRNDIPNRIKRHFFSVNMTSPSQKSIENIYGRILEALFPVKKYSNEVIQAKNVVVDATIHLWNLIKRRLLPTPAKFHYVFNMRELSRTFQGICSCAAKPEYKVIMNCTKLTEACTPEFFLMSLWRHECERVFEDKLVNQEDKDIFHNLMDKVTIEKFKDLFNMDDEELKTNNLFCDFQRDDVFDEYGDLTEEAPFVYEAVPSLEAIKVVINQKLVGYNEKNPGKNMNLVIFDDACRHMLRIARVINMPRGSSLLVGIGGSGKQSLTKLSAYICKQVFFQISLTKTYNTGSLKDDLKALYQDAGPGGKSVTFILTDAEIK